VSTIKKLAGQTAVYGLSSIAGRFINYLLVPLFTRVFTQAEYGINAEFYAYISFLNILLTHGMETAFFRFAQENNSRKVYAQAFISIFGASSFFFLLVLLGGNFISNQIGYGLHPEYLTYAAGILILDALAAIPFALLREQKKALRFAVIKNLNIFINVGINLYLLVFCPWFANVYKISPPFAIINPGIEVVFIANLIASLVTLILLFPELRQISFVFDKQLWQQMMVYAIPMIWVGFAGMINETLDRALLRYVWPDPIEAQQMNGIYSANYKLSIIITLFIQAYKFAAEPFFFAHAKQTDKRSLYAEVMNYFTWICLFIFILVSSFLHYFKSFIGPDFHEGLKVVPILLWANIFLGLYYNVSIWYKLSNQTKKGALISLIGAGITIVLNLILIPILGYEGCAWTTFICYLTMLVIGYYWGQKYYPIPYNIKRIALYALSAILIYIFITYVSLQIEPNSFLGFAIRLVALFLFAGLGLKMEFKNLVASKNGA
jgi:O-antigen/teichoic acid export membrane protein